MKARLLIVCLLVSALLVIPAYAVEGDAAPSEEVTEPVSIETSKEEEGVTVNVTIQNPETVPAADAAETLLEDETVV
ncbi:hypothetical protein [Oscillibacter sp.]|uniref:hypothetical protein n=1 Tax=Oscillibacter sp. TaxID=1945593 RepID=UPI00260BEBC0|nr:hypothetical protein [Oscillibacter sp.]MDD3346226.1 hypothetical protein [Oscillibacter sp.]